MNFNKYRKYDTITLQGLFAEVYHENKYGEIEEEPTKNADQLNGKPIFTKAEMFDFEKFVLDEINQHFTKDLKSNDITLCGNWLYFHKRENKDGIEDPNGKYYVGYAVIVSINGLDIQKEDLHEIFPNFTVSEN